MTFANHLYQYRELLFSLGWREIQGRYRGSILGRAWTVITPLLMLTVYTLVFSQIFQTRWQDVKQLGPMGFALNIFAGMIVFGLFAESASSAPSKILENPGFVKKVVFPLEILPVLPVMSAYFHAICSLVVLAVFALLTVHTIPITFIWVPLIWLPLTLICLAISWLLSATGVYLRDVGQSIGVVINMAMFLSAVFYPISALPVRWQPLLKLNPIAATIDQTRMAAIHGQTPGIIPWLIGIGAGLGLCELSFRFFRRAKRGFPDVI